MAKRWTSTTVHVPATGARGKRTSMNKNFRRSFKKYRGQGK